MSEFCSIPALLGLGLGFAYLLLHFLAKQKEHKNKTVNGSMGWPLVGETLALLKPHTSNSVGPFLQQRCSRYGKVFKSHVFGSPTIVSCDHELNIFILQNEEKLFKASYPKPMHGILGKLSLLTVSGELHKKLRNVAVNFIAVSKSSPSFLHFIEKLSISMMRSWMRRNEIEFCKEIRKFTINLMLKHLLSIEPEEPQANKILKDFLTYMKGFVSLPLYIPGTAFANAVKARTRLTTKVKDIMDRRRSNENVTGPAKGDFLDVILSKQTLNDEETVSIVLDILLGGYETTATLLPLILYFLGQAPNVLEKLKEEHQAIRGNKKDGELLDWQDYNKMEITQYVISESMRCGNVVKFVHREAIEDVKFKDYMIPCGWKVLPMFTAAHLDPALHENPTEFNPWRWTEEKEMKKKVMPFGGGPRLCPGIDLGRVEMAFFLHHLVLNFRWRMKADEAPIAYPYVEFKRGMVLAIEPTDSHSSSKLVM